MIKWRISKYGDLPVSFHDNLAFFIRLLLDPFILTGLLGAFIASLFWMAAMTKFELSFAYPFMGLNFVLLFVFSMFFFNESFSLMKLVGLVCIIIGIFFSSRAG